MNEEINVYVNNFGVSASPVDVRLRFTTIDNKEIMAYMSYSTLKSLVEKSSEVLQELETIIDIKSAEEIDDKMRNKTNFKDNEDDSSIKG